MESLGAPAAPVPWVALTGERVRLEPQQELHAELAYRQLTERDGRGQRVVDGLHWDGPQDLEELRAIYRAGLEMGSRGLDWHFVVLERETRAAVGALTLRFAGHAASGDVGYWIASEHQGRGFASDALRLAVHLAFQWQGASSLFAWVFADNWASRRVLERNSFHLVHTSPRRFQKYGVWRDEAHFVLLRAEWERGRAAFRPSAEELPAQGFLAAGGPPEG